MKTARADLSIGVSGPNLRAQVGESEAKRPSNSSTVSRANDGKPGFAYGRPVTAKTPKEPASQAGSIRPHSAHAAKRSQHYHKNTVEAKFTRPSAMKMTKAEHQLNNQEDFSEKGHKL